MKIIIRYPNRHVPSNVDATWLSYRTQDTGHYSSTSPSHVQHIVYYPTQLLVREKKKILEYNGYIDKRSVTKSINYLFLKVYVPS